MYNLLLEREQTEDSQSPRIKKLVFGLHANSNTSFTSTNDIFNISVLGLPDGSSLVDTFQNIQGEKFDGTLPAQIGIGASYVDGNKFSVGINYERTNWSDFNAEFVNNNLKSTFDLSFGGFYRPDYKSISNYFSRVYYRFGAFYKTVPVEVTQGEDIDDLGFSVGLGMPFFYQRKISHANLGVTLGIRGRDTAIEERYIRFTFSFTFNDDEWFIKRKYN